MKTGPVDHADWNFRGALGLIQRERFRAALSLVPPETERLLELGYGSGIFLPALADRTKQLYGIDIHEKGGEVFSALRSESVSAYLATAVAEALPFDNGSFDTVVAISTLEFVSDLAEVCAEVQRILKPDGSFVVITPGKSKLVDLGLLALTGKSADRDFGERRELLVNTLMRSFQVAKRLHIPRIGSSLCTLYTALQLKRIG